MSIETGEKQALEEAFSVRHSIRLALARPEKLPREHTQELAQVCSLSAPVATALTLAQRFVTMRREKQVEALPSWLASAQTSSVRELRKALCGTARRWKRPSPEPRVNEEHMSTWIHMHV